MSSLFSAQWYRVARARPQLRLQVKVQRQHWRDQRWYVLSDTVSGRQHRINEQAYQFIGRCDGSRTVHDVWSALLEAMPDQAPTQDEVLSLLGTLHDNELLQADLGIDCDLVIARSNERRSKKRAKLLNPFSFQLPLGDPSRWLVHFDPLARWLCQPWVLVVWLVALCAGILVAASEWTALVQHAQVQMLAPSSLWMAWLLYPVMKVLHELAHAMAVRRWGGEVHEIGVALMFLVPAPYVDASAASAFPKRRHRVLVGAAGVMVETSVALVGLWLWMNTQAGWVHDAAFVALFLGAGSTLLFNANPLLKFDGYHVMCDLFDVPNLAARSQAYWIHHLSRVLLRTETELPAHADSERKWLRAYAPLSWAYRLGISVGLVLWLGGKWVLLGFMAALYGVFTVMVQPLLTWSRQVLTVANPGRDMARVQLRMGCMAVAALALVFVLPLPLATVAPAVVWLPDQAQIRPEVDGFIEAVPLADGALVRAGDVVVQLANPDLNALRSQLESQLERTQVEQQMMLTRDPATAQNHSIELARLRGEWARVDEKIARLQIRAETAGTLVMPHSAELVGTYVRRGSTIGHVLQPGSLRVRAAVAGPDAHLVRHRTQRADVRLSDDLGKRWTVTLVSDSPAATRQLPSAALSQSGGGPYLTDPTDPANLQAIEPVFLMDLNVDESILQRVGGRAWVRFDHGAEPLAMQLYRRTMQLFLQHFDAGGA